MTKTQICKEINLLTIAIEKALENGGVQTLKTEGIEFSLSLTGLYTKRDNLYRKLRRKHGSGRNYIV